MVWSLRGTSTLVVDPWIREQLHWLFARQSKTKRSAEYLHPKVKFTITLIHAPTPRGLGNGEPSLALWLCVGYGLAMGEGRRKEKKSPRGREATEGPFQVVLKHLDSLGCGYDEAGSDCGDLQEAVDFPLHEIGDVANQAWPIASKVKVT
jgi:hypothetical protein